MFHLGLIIPIIEIGNFRILHPVMKLFSPMWAPDIAHFACLFLFLVLITFLKCTCWWPFSKIYNGEPLQISKVCSSLFSSSVFWTLAALFTLDHHFCHPNSWSLLVSTCFSFSELWPRNSLMEVIWGKDSVYLIYLQIGMPFRHFLGSCWNCCPIIYFLFSFLFYFLSIF